MRKRFIVCSLFFLLFVLATLNSAHAQETGHMTLLAVSEATQLGSTADLYLTMQNGRGSVYIETAPLTKLDTQLSTRFAQQIACDFIEQDCLNKDFFYTIRSDAAIVGGPSAGASIAALTVAMLEGLEINESIAITGTINVGGLIGPVSGIVGKIDAARDAGLTKVLIPAGTRFEETPDVIYNDLLLNTSAPYMHMNNETNQTEVDAIAYGEHQGIEVQEVATLQEVVYITTGHWYERDESPIDPPIWYTETMQTIADDLCYRNRQLAAIIETIEYENQTEQQTIQEEIINSTRRAENATAYDMDYVAASTCFSSNIQLQYEINLNTDNLIEEVNKSLGEINESVEILQEEIDEKELLTITDLQTYLVVNERLKEARETTTEIKLQLQLNATAADIAYNSAYAQERLYSATAWTQFFANTGSELTLNTQALEQSCAHKRAEAQERYQFVKLSTIQALDKISTYLSLADAAADEGNYIKCLDMASRAKANLDIIMSLVGIKEEEELVDLVETRLRIARQILNKQKDNGYFPMLGYSYYQYAEFLKEEQPYSALIYSHYALEFSNLDMYFKERERSWFVVVDTENMLYFGAGLLTGVIVCCLISLGKRQKKKDAKK